MGHQGPEGGVMGIRMGDIKRDVGFRGGSAKLVAPAGCVREVRAGGVLTELAPCDLSRTRMQRFSEDLREWRVMYKEWTEHRSEYESEARAKDLIHGKVGPH
eukprot:651959-Rhodomonas_salina.1